jgi:hypothetical protein
MNKNVFLQREYKLTRNPFDSRVDLTAPMAGRASESKRWKQLIEGRKGNTGSSLNFIKGDYGVGKSYSLHQIYEYCKNDKEILPISLKFLPEDNISKFGLDFIRRIFANFEPKDIATEPPSEAFDELLAIFPDVGMVLKRLFLGDDGLAAGFLRGDRPLTTHEARQLGNARKMNSTEVAKEYLLGFLFLLKKANILSLVLLVDEMEYVFSQMTGARAANVFNSLRDFYDLPQSEKALRLKFPLANIIFFFAISQSGWTKLSDSEKKEQRTGGPVQPFLDRKEDVIELLPLNEAETKQLIELRLSRSRTPGGQKNEVLIPYTNDFVRYIFGLTQGNPRHIIERCDRVLIQGLQDMVPQLDEAYAREVLRNVGLPWELASK